MKELILTKTEVPPFAKIIAEELAYKNILCLTGDLGAGKTFFSSKVIQLLTGDEALSVTSPTFSIVNVYNTKNEKSIYHFDLYRIKTLKELESIGFFEALNEGICIIEWWNIFESELKNYLKNAIFLDIKYINKNKRKFIYV